MSPAQQLLGTLVLASIVAVLLRLVSRRAPVPYPVLLAVLGVGVAAIPGVTVGPLGSDAILLGFVPGLVFEGARTISLPALRRMARPVIALATVGVAATVGAIGVLAHWVVGLDWTEGVLLGAVLAPTDPIAVVAVLRRVHAPGRLTALLEGESLLNDGTGVAVFAAVVAALDGGAPTPAGIAGRFAVLVAGGVLIGGAAGAAAVALLATVHEVQSEILLTVALAYGSYLAADLAHVSGIVAVVTAALVLAGSARRFPQLHARGLDEFWGVLAFILNAILFLLIGSALPLREVTATIGSVAAAYGITLAARVVTVHAILLALDPLGRRIPHRWRTVIIWGGMRGALSIALALVIAQRPDVDHRVAVLAYGVALITIVLQGGTIRWLVPRPAERLPAADVPASVTASP